MSSYFYHVSNKFGGRIFCVVGGFCDSVGFYLLKGLFTASITGNIVKFSVDTGNGQFAITYFVVTMTFGVGAAIVRYFVILLQSLTEYTNLTIAILMLILEILFLSTAMIVGYFLKSQLDNAQDVDNWAIMVVGLILSLAMGIQVHENKNKYLKNYNYTLFLNLVRNINITI